MAKKYKEKSKFATDKGFDFAAACAEFNNVARCVFGGVEPKFRPVSNFDLEDYVMLPKDKVADILSYLSCIAAILKGGDK